MRNDFINKKVFINSTNYFHNEVLDFVRSTVIGAYPDGSNFKFRAMDNESSLGACPTRTAEKTFFNAPTVRKFAEIKRVEADLFVICSTDTRICVHTCKYYKDQYTGEDKYIAQAGHLTMYFNNVKGTKYNYNYEIVKTYDKVIQKVVALCSPYFITGKIKPEPIDLSIYIDRISDAVLSHHHSVTDYEIKTITKHIRKELKKRLIVEES